MLWLRNNEKKSTHSNLEACVRMIHLQVYIGSAVVECLTSDPRAAGSSLTDIAALCP